MKKYICEVCDWVYEPELGVPEDGIPPGTPFDELPDDFVCPDCGADKGAFDSVD